VNGFLLHLLPNMMCCITTDPKPMESINFGLNLQNYEPKATFLLFYVDLFQVSVSISKT
jgi:hypothetical protein